jgi:hypothetical protein
MDPVKMKAPMPQVNSQSAQHPDLADNEEESATEHEFHETLNSEISAAGESEPAAVVAPKGKRRRRAASSGVITA